MPEQLHPRHHGSPALIWVSMLVAGAVVAGCGSSSITAASSGSAVGSSAAAGSGSTAPASGAPASGASSSTAPASAATQSAAAGGGAAALVPAAVRQAGVLKVATGSGYPPFEFYDTDNKTLIGVDPELMQALGAELKLKVTLTDLKFDAIIPGLQSKRFDAGSAAMGITPVRNKVVDFVSYFEGGTSLMVKTGNPDKLTLATLCGHKIAVEKGTIYADDYLPSFASACTSAGKPAVSVDVYPDHRRPPWPSPAVALMRPCRITARWPTSPRRRRGSSRSFRRTTSPPPTALHFPRAPRSHRRCRPA